MRDIEIVGNKRNQYRYTQRSIAIQYGEEGVKWYNCILLENIMTLETTVSEFSDFFLSKNIINYSIKTKLNNYSSTIVMFLNYVFFKMENPIASIEHISIELGERFLALYGEGHLGRKNQYKTDESIKRVANTLTSFYYYLHKAKNDRRRRYAMKYIGSDTFEFANVRRKSRAVVGEDRFYDKKHLECIFVYSLYNITSASKLKKPTEYLIYSMIDIAEQYDPMLAFPIAMGAFAGLRQGEICQLCNANIQAISILGECSEFMVDFRKVKLLRGDGILTGSIKKKRIQRVYSSFLQYIHALYIQHKTYLKQEGYDNEYGAIVLDTNGQAMTTNCFRKRFINLTLKLVERLYNVKTIEGIMALQLLTNYRMTPHALRYFFTQYLTNVGESAHVLASYRGDSDLSSALTYLRESPKNSEEIKKLQNSFIESFCKFKDISISDLKEKIGMK